MFTFWTSDSCGTAREHARIASNVDVRRILDPPYIPGSQWLVGPGHGLAVGLVRQMVTMDILQRVGLVTVRRMVRGY